MLVFPMAMSVNKAGTTCSIMTMQGMYTLSLSAPYTYALTIHYSIDLQLQSLAWHTWFTLTSTFGRLYYVL